MKSESVDSHLVKDLCYSVIQKKKMDIKKYTLPYSNRMDDFCYFLYAVEARQPFLDHRIVELGLGLEDKYAIRKGYNLFCAR